MAVLVDTNIISDILTDDPRWRSWSQLQLDTYRADGLVINAIIYAEISVPALDLNEIDTLLLEFGLELLEIPRPGLFTAGKAFARYRASGGARLAPLPDFFIGGHAEAASLPLITRDTARFRTYFPTVTLITPDPFSLEMRESTDSES